MASSEPATATDTSAELDRLCVDTIRTLSMDAVQKASSGHPGTPMALAPLIYTLYTRVMRHNPSDPEWINRDRFILSAGHASMLLYSSLYLTGYPLTLEDIKRFRQVGSPTAGHPERWASPGIEATTGPLGQGISMSVGLALAERMLAARFNEPGHEIVDHYTFTIASDGDIQEGVSSEASSLAGHLGLGRLIAYFDNNHIQLASPTSATISEDTGARYEAYGWHVQNVGEDLSLERLEEATREAMSVQERPSLIILRSHIGYGAPHKQDTSAAHGSPLGEDEVRAAKKFYGWDPDKHFFIPDEALRHFRRCCERGRKLQSEWEERFAAYRQEHPSKAQRLELAVTSRLPDGWERDLPRFDPADDPMATRKASGAVIQWAATAIPHLIGGSADLATSNNTDIEGAEDVEQGSYGGRNIRYGVREHAMAAVTNGLCLHGFRAFGGTFLVFSDYMRGALRLSALQRLPAVWVYTHDSIGLGEDGPTHQPIEHLAGLRAMPVLRLIRPADANETALAWRFALRNAEAPTALALTRQNLPILDPRAIPDDAIERGAYVLRDADGSGGPPELILIGTGSEVPLCLEAAEALDGIRVRVVSMPCMDTFTEADADYREQVLPAACPNRIAVEAASPLGWEKWIGEQGAFIGMHSFGESGPYKDVYEHFGITAEHVAREARRLLGR